MSAREEITVVARWQPAPGAMNDVLSILAELGPKSRAEAGCLGYEVFQGQGDAGQLLLIERYRDAAALDAHKQSAHYQELVVKRAIPLLANRKVELLRALDPA